MFLLLLATTFTLITPALNVITILLYIYIYTLDSHSLIKFGDHIPVCKVAQFTDQM